MSAVLYGIDELLAKHREDVSLPKEELVEKLGLTEKVSHTVTSAVLDYCYQHPAHTGFHSFLFFCQYYLSAHFDQGFGRFQYPIFDYLTNLRPGKHTLILFPREHGKSTLFTFAFVLWCICYRKKRHIILPSAVRETAEKFLMNMKTELQTNPLILRDFGDLIDEPAARKGKRPSRAQYIRTSNYVVVRVASTGTTIRGALEALPKELEEDFLGIDPKSGEPLYRMHSLRPDFILLDDAVDDKKTLNRRVRDRTWNWFWMNCFSAQQMGESNVMVVGTTLHEDDLVSRLLKDQNQTGDWFKLCLPAANPDRPFDDEGNPIDCLFPEKWAKLDPREVEVVDPLTGQVTKKRFSYLWWRWRELGPAFGPEFLMRPVGASTRYFKREDFGWYVVNSPQVTPELFDVYYRTTGRLLEYLPDDLICVTTLDPAGTDEGSMDESVTDPDWTVVMTTGYSPTTKKFYMVAINRMRCSPGDMLRQILVHLQMFDARHGAKYIPDPASPDVAYRGFPFMHLGVGIETVAFQKVLAPMFEELAATLGMFPIVFEMNRGSRRGKRLRAMLPATLCQNNMLMFPYLMQGIQDPSTEALFEELAGFPDGAPHDDTVDALSDGVHILHAYSLQLGRGLTGTAAVRELLNGDYGMTTSLKRDEIVAAMDRQFRVPTAPQLSPASFVQGGAPVQYAP